MRRWIVRRALAMVPLLVGITLVSYAVIRLAPGGPVDAQSEMNPRMTAEARQKLVEIYGLDRPVYEQYLSWAWRVARLDLGRSMVDGRPVLEKIAQALPVTLGVNALSLVIVFAAGIPLGVWSAVRRGSAVERGVTTLTLAALAVPAYWVALLLISGLGVGLRLLPVTGLQSLEHELLSPFERVLDTARHLVLPVFVSALAGTAVVARFMRASLGQTLTRGYVRAARARGLSEHAVVYRHALRNALLPVITLLGLSLPGLLGGSVLFETLFALPGMGRLFYDAVNTRDYPLVMGVLVLGAIVTLLGNFLADLGYLWADPRIRTAHREGTSR
ncbi:MAG: Dipeptide transport system permease protein DppB [Candidatus Omnitrophica bacterium]|nr:Dipeptide transport system permease protein DppB [Candidatus Omnitrophota bacterium]